MSYTLNRKGSQIDAIFNKVDSLFFAQYDETLYSEITSALAADKTVFAFKDGECYVYAGDADGDGYVFARSGVTVSSDGTFILLANQHIKYVLVDTADAWYADVTYIAPISSPEFTGVPTAPTPASGNSSSRIATTKFVSDAVSVEKTRAEAAEALKAPLASPALTGTPTAPTAASGTNTTQIATTAFVKTAVDAEASARDAAIAGMIYIDSEGRTCVND